MSTRQLQNFLADYLIMRWVYPPLFFGVAVIHLLWAVGCFCSNAPLHTVGIEPVHLLTAQWLGTASWVATGTVFLVSAILGFIGFKQHTKFGVLCLIPQQLLLLVSAYWAIACMIGGHYADNAAYPVWFITTDQSWQIAVAAWHVLCMGVLFNSVFIRLRHLPEGYLHSPDL